MNLINKTIFCKDNLEILRGIDSESVDMIYLDPPFNSKKQWDAPVGSSAEGASFKDTWTVDDVKDEWIDEIRAEHPALHEFLNSFKLWGEQSDVAYITYMSIRIIEMRRVLKQSGTLFYHCDHAMNDYIKVMLDIIFGRHHDINNLVWHYSGGTAPKKHLPKKHDNIFWYRKSEEYVINQDAVRVAYAATSAYAKTGITSKAGKKYMPNKKGKVSDDVWYIPILNPMSKERLGYPTQKPLTLLRRIIEMSTNEGDMVLDPFCGCATTCVAAEQTGRRWVGIDVSIKAYELVQERLKTDAPTSLFSQVPVNFTTEAPKRGVDVVEDKKFVYVISNKSYPNEFKVGIAANVKSRFNSYKTASPNRDDWKLEYYVRVPNYREIEKSTHEYFPNKHEWVQGKLEDIVNYIKSKL